MVSPGRARARAFGRMPLPTSAILAICDAVLGEVGRRSHLFGWLRDPAAGRDQWLAVDAYYPGHRLVVHCTAAGAETARLYGELIPAHGLRLLELDPDELADDEDGPQAAIEALIAELGPLRAPPPPDQGERRGERHRPGCRLPDPAAGAALPSGSGSHRRPARGGGRASGARDRRPDRGRAPRASRTRRATRSGRPGRSRARRAAGSGRAIRSRAAPLRAPSLIVGLALVCVLFIEVYVGVVPLVTGGHMLFAFGLSLDACARALGTIAAARTDRQDLTWLCVLGGSPAVAWFAMFHPSGPVEVEPAPLAGLLGLLACGLLGLAIVVAALGG